MIGEAARSKEEYDNGVRTLSGRLDWRWREIVEESLIDPTVAIERGYYLEKTKAGLSRLGYSKQQQQAPAIVIPRFAPSGEEIAPQIKPENPRVQDRNGTPRPVKYESPPKAEKRLSVHPRAVKYMRTMHPIFFTEGDKKADSLLSRKAVAVSIQGVAGWSVPRDLEDIKLYGRRVILAFDADQMVNPNVLRELEKFAAFLASRGARVEYLRWPEEYRGKTTGVDDYFAAGGNMQELLSWCEDAPDPDATPVGVSMADIEPEQVEWFWNRRIPKGKVTILDGDPGRGKSLILYDLAARATAGKPLPDGQSTEQAGAIIVSAEDGAADTIVPRFLAAGGNPDRARIMGSDKPFSIPEDLDQLERAIQQTGAAFVAIDPVMSFLSDKVNSNSDQQVRTAMQPLAHMAERTGAAIVICRHLNKSSGGQTIYRGQGSIGFIGIVRSGLIVGNHPERDGMFVLAGQKHNLSKPPDSLGYRIRDAAPGDETAVIEYLGRSEVTADQMNGTPEDEGERDRLTEAKEFLRDILRAGPVSSKRIKAEASEADISWRTIERAKAALKVQSIKDPDTGKWQWVLWGPPEDADTPTPEHGGDGGLGGVGTPPSEAEMADFDFSTTTTTTKKAYIKEDRQDRQDRQPPKGDRPAESANEDRQPEDRQPEDRQRCEHGDVGSECPFCEDKYL